MEQAFTCFYRSVPTVVLATIANIPLVRLGGDGLNDLREDVYDAAFNTNCRAGGGDPYVTALMGGEPYAVWY